MQIRSRLGLVALVFLCTISARAHAGDWPMWRHDANRSGASPSELPAKLHPQWVRGYVPLKPAWPDQAKMQFDIVREPVVEGRTMYINSSRADAVRAIDTRTGDEKWTYFTDGPVRFAPAVWEGRVYFASDDGYLYCVKGDTGDLLWKFRGGPNDRKILGNERLISTWPARGAPVIADGQVYFAASIWPFMGIFIHALDARTGQVIWTNDGDGSLYMKQPHNTDSFASIAPQGPIVVIGDTLLIPGGRSVPAAFDRKTGKLLRYQLAENGKRGGGSEVAAVKDVFFNGGSIFDVASEKYLSDYGKQVVLTDDRVFTYDAKGVFHVLNLTNRKTQEATTTDSKGKKVKVTRFSMPELAVAKLANVDTMIKAGSRIYFGGPKQISVMEWDEETMKLTPGETIAVEGNVVRLIAADDRLIAVTREGQIYCFGGEQTKTLVHTRFVQEKSPVAPEVQAKVDRILKDAGSRSGYAVVWGNGDGRVVEALVQQTALHLVVVEPNLDKIQTFRRQWTKSGLYGNRIAIIPGDAKSVQLPPYLASAMVCEDASQFDEDALAKVYQTLRPFGGTFFILNAETKLATSKLVNAKVARDADLLTITRAGALPGAGNFTHENADAANTRVSRDMLVKAPMGVLWFGGPPNDVILPRHGHGPQPQVIDGRLIIEGIDLMRAIDIYTGRLLWECKLPGVGAFYNNLAHQPGANAAGSNFVSTSDGIYIAYHNRCVRLDPESGKKVGEYPMPILPGMKASPRWGYINVAGDFLIGGADPLFDPKLAPPPPKKGETGDDKDPAPKKETAKKSELKEPEKKVDPKEPEKKTAKDSAINKLLKIAKGFSDNMSASRHLVIMDRQTGKTLWTASAQFAFRHNAICVGGDRLYAIDRMSGEQVLRFQRENGEVDPPPARLTAFDLKTGKVLWSTTKEVFGTWLSYSDERDILVEAGRIAPDKLFDEPKGMRAYSAKDGKSLWFEKAHTGPAMIHHDTILQGQGACDLLTGKLKMRSDPITAESTPWTWIRNYGCNTPAASEHLMTFRSGAAGYFDLCNDGGTGNFGGFRSSCTNNLIVAGGILTAPDYTRTCTCAYQNQTSIALIHMPEVEMWTSFGTKEVKGVVQRLGLNFGGAGDRKAENGTLWLEYPSIGGTSPSVKVTTKPAAPELFRRHSSAVAGSYNWVTSSGAKNINEITVTLGKMDAERKYTVKLYFAEPDRLDAGQRVFDVSIQGTEVLKNFDIVKEANGVERTVSREFKGIAANGEMTIQLTPSAQASIRAPVLCGLELIAEEK
jgi:outer membrane protein assembly factor BamB